MDSIERENLAMKRFNILNIVRFVGAASALAGAANIGGKLLPDFTPWLGYVLLINGIADVLFIPVLLKKSWQKQDSAQG
jgi:hypothetical protein